MIYNSDTYRCFPDRTIRNQATGALETPVLLKKLLIRHPSAIPTQQTVDFGILDRILNDEL